MLNGSDSQTQSHQAFYVDVITLNQLKTMQNSKPIAGLFLTLFQFSFSGGWTLLMFVYLSPERAIVCSLAAPGPRQDRVGYCLR